MLYTRKEISDRYNSTYQLNKALENKEIFKIENGIYSDDNFVDPMAVIDKKYPDFIFTMDTAFYYWSLTDVVPEIYHVATKKTSIRLKSNDIKQYFVDDELFELGKTRIDADGTMINVYDRERMLIELVRKKKQLPFDYYKEVISSYRKLTGKLDVSKLMKYLSHYKNENSLFDKLQYEVY